MSAYSLREACALIGLPRRAWYRAHQPAPPPQPSQAPPPDPPRALSAAERQAVLDQLHTHRFLDLPPREVYATLLEEGVYLCSWRTMYRILHERSEVKERRLQRTHPRHAIPRLVARSPNDVWSWDITLLRGPTPRQFFYLYVILALYRRYIVGWMVAPVESDALAEHFIETTCARQGVLRDQLTLHADRGSVMRSQLVSELLAKLGVSQSHSRPRVSNDNPMSESQFKTLKYHGTFPKRFEDLEDARSFLGQWFPWYNLEHHHVGLALYTPAQVYCGQVEAVRGVRQAALDAAYTAHPERFVHGPPQARRPPTEVRINRPADADRPATIEEEQPPAPS